jgi:polysaccharide export outer membrane protein
MKGFSPSLAALRVGETAVSDNNPLQPLCAALLCASLVFGGASVPAKAQAPSPPAVQSGQASPSPAKAPSSQAESDGGSRDVSSPNYVLGPEDVIAVEVARHPDMNTEALVLEDGTITVSRVGRLSVTGKTVQELQQLLTQKYLEILRKPEVTVGVKTPRVERVFVNGAVNKPGAVDLKKENWRITEALAQAGGLSLRPDWVTMTLTRKSGGTVNVPVEQILAHPESSENLPLQPGDILIVSEIPEQKIFVNGAVNKPGVYDLREVNAKAGSVNVLEALALAGGPKEDAALSQAVIYRAGDKAANGAPKEEHVNLAMLQNTHPVPTLPASATPSSPPPATAAAPANAVNEDAARRVLLHPGDMLQIPESNAQIVVMGQVTKPGVYPISEDRPVYVMDAIGYAGGPTDRAKMGSVGILRNPAPNAPNAKPQVIEVNIDRMIGKKDFSQNQVLRPGDVVYVPETGKPNWSKVLPAVSSIANTLFFLGLGK